MNKLSIGPQLRTTSVLVVHLLVMHCSRGQSKLIGSSQPIVATVGDDIILPCHLEPAVDVAAMTLEWSTSELDLRFVFVWRAGQELVKTKHPSYKGRTSLFTDELKQGNISLKLCKVKPADEGTYLCFIANLNKASLVELVVGAAASPVISLKEIEVIKGGVVLQCESKGWYPEPELLWLDTEGKILSAGPTETVRGPDDLYTVSSRVTVEKRHSNNITCRVKQSNINQIRETQIHVPDGLFDVLFSSLIVILSLGVGLAVSFMLIVFIVLWRIIKSKRRQREENYKMEVEKKSKHVNQLMTESQKLKKERQKSEDQIQQLENRIQELEKQLQAKNEKWFPWFRS
uniref:Ig-like domain-containing protein n=1 Tax=Anabas testudineus TaxID=64144 RepID=A0A7N6AJC4_ANATE